jgi:hypothetical protein
VTKKKAAKRAAAPAAPKPKSENITYTIRTIPRTTWERFASVLHKDGRQVGWAIEKFVEKVASGQFTFE